MKIGPFEKYVGCSLERGGSRCACHARQERTDIDVYGRNKHKLSCLKFVGVYHSFSAIFKRK
jgi:hypothetical protein